MIWALSRFYNTEECLTGLLRKISNEIETGLFFSRTRSRDTLLVFLVRQRFSESL